MIQHQKKNGSGVTLTAPWNNLSHSNAARIPSQVEPLRYRRLEGMGTPEAKLRRMLQWNPAQGAWYHLKTYKGMWLDPTIRNLLASRAKENLPAQMAAVAKSLQLDKPSPLAAAAVAVAAAAAADSGNAEMVDFGAEAAEFASSLFTREGVAKAAPGELARAAHRTGKMKELQKRLTQLLARKGGMKNVDQLARELEAVEGRAGGKRRGRETRKWVLPSPKSSRSNQGGGRGRGRGRGGGQQRARGRRKRVRGSSSDGEESDEDSDGWVPLSVSAWGKSGDGG